jgi:heme a synthase
MGWLMVKSGLVDNPHVSHYRLAAHLLLATLIAGMVYATIMQLDKVQGKTGESSNMMALIILCLIVAQITYGAFVAGLKAGYMYNEFPLMGGQFFPPEQWVLSPAWRNVLEHHATVQFIHRWLGCMVLAGIIWQYIRLQNAATLRVLLVAVLQVGLGIATLVSEVQIALASLHQVGAMLLLLTQIHVWMGYDAHAT